MSAVADVLKIVKERLFSSEILEGIFKEITLKEFPIAKNWPAIHVNAEDSNTTIAGKSIGKSDRVTQIRVYVTLAKKDLEELDISIWETIDTVRSVLIGDGKQDRFWGGLCDYPTLTFDVRTVPSPVGSVYLGTRVILFDAHIKELLY